MTPFRTIVVDPPWEHSDGTGLNFATGKMTGLSYDVMPIQQIMALPVRELAAPGAHLYLWTTQRFLRVAFDVADAWGFRPACTLAWCKAARGWAPGGSRFQNNLEFILFCDSPKTPEAVELGDFIKRGMKAAGLSLKDINRAFGFRGGMASNWTLGYCTPTEEQYAQLRELLDLGDDFDSFVRDLNVRKLNPQAKQDGRGQWYQWPRGAHSAKPEAFLDLVEQVSPGPYAELFARRARFGWEYPIGDQALGGVAA